MTVLNALSKEDKALFMDYIYSHGGRRNSFQSCVTSDYLLRFWESAKNDYLFKLLKGNLILSKEITFEKSEAQLEEEIRTQMTNYAPKSKDCEEFLSHWHDFVVENWGGTDDRDNRNIYFSLFNLVGEYMLASNRYTGRAVNISLPNDKVYRLSPGAKVSKAIGKIAAAYGIPKYEEFRIAHSQILNERTVKGEFCLSIHPMDYATMSDNDCGWSSCMSWADHGDFRQGTVEMMNSPMVLVAYLKSSTDLRINCYDETYWNSKRWRELFIVTPGFIMGIKGYPYWNHSIEEEILRWIKELAEEAEIGSYENIIRTYEADNDVKGVIEDDEKIASIRFSTHQMYNDVYSEHAIILNNEYEVDEDVHYSGVDECLCCGEPMYGNYECEHDLFCTNCDPAYTCAECGAYYDRDELYELDGILYCEYCYGEYATECDCCGEVHHSSHMNDIYIMVEDKGINLDYHITLDEDCFNSGELFESGVGVLVTTELNTYRSYICVPMESLTDKGYEIFGITSVEDFLAEDFTLITNIRDDSFDYYF